MALNNTGNAVGSDSPLDLQDNATVLDELINGTDLTVTGRLGSVLKSYAALVKQMESSGGALAYKDAATLLASTPSTSNVLAMDTATGTWYFWNGTAWSSSVYQFSDKFSRVNNQLQNILVSTNLLEAAVAILNADSSQYVTQIQRHFIALQSLEKDVYKINDIVQDPENERLSGLMLRQYLMQELSKFDGFDPENVVSEDTVREAVAAYSTPERYTDQYSFPKPDSLVRIDLTITGSLPTNKDQDDVHGTIRLNFDGVVQTLNCGVGVQGATSANYAKKNLNIEFFNSDAYDDNAEIKIGNLLPHKKLVFKANWIDATHVRNTMNYMLWSQFVESRDLWPQNEVDTPLAGVFGTSSVATGATGYPTLFPCVMYVNGEFYGIGDIGTAKRRENYNLSKNKPLQIQLDHGGWDPINKSVDNYNSGSIEIGAPSKPTDDTLAALAEWDTFATSVISGDVSNFDTHLDKQNITDFMILCEFIVANDLIGPNSIKNVQQISYDGVKWFFMPYDLDTCYGLRWDGAVIVGGQTDIKMYSSFWINCTKAVTTEFLNSRYAYLRDKGILTVKNISNICRELQCKYTSDLFDAEWSKWPSVPSLNITSVSQVIEWVETRLTFLDTHYNYTA